MTDSLHRDGGQTGSPDAKLLNEIRSKWGIDESKMADNVLDIQL